jgi:acyl carrier protein
LLVRYGLPVLVNEVFPLMFRPAVYRAAGLPGVRSWIEARSSPQRRALVQQAGRSLVGALVNAGAFSADRVTWPWRWLAGSGHEPATTEKADTRAQPPRPAVPAVPVTPVAGTSAGVVRDLIGRFAPEPEPAPGPDVRLIEDLDYDSLALMELAVAIGNAVGLEIGDAEAFEMFVEVGTVAEVESLVADALARQVR